MKSHFPIINYFEKKHIIYADSECCNNIKTEDCY